MEIPYCEQKQTCTNLSLSKLELDNWQETVIRINPPHDNLFASTMITALMILRGQVNVLTAQKNIHCFYEARASDLSTILV